jgi:hypothetical protein
LIKGTPKRWKTVEREDPKQMGVGRETQQQHKRKYGSKGWLGIYGGDQGFGFGLCL